MFTSLWRQPAIALVAALALPLGAGAQQPADTAAPPAAEPEAPALDFSAWIFGSFNVQTDSATRANFGGEARNRFDVDRAYLTFRGRVSERAGFRVTTDIKQSAGAPGFYNGWFVRLKYAYLNYDFLKPERGSGGARGFARIGMLHTLLIDHYEDFWLRYIGRSPTERFGFFSSSDVGAAAGLTFPDGWGEMYATVTNGVGYENPETDRFKDLGVRLTITPLGRVQEPGADPGVPWYIETLTISPWVYLGRRESAFLASDSVTDALTRNRYGVFVGVRDPRLTLGVEWAQRVDETEAGATLPLRSVSETTGRLVDAFAIVRPSAWMEPERTSNWGVLARYDRFTPDTDADPTQSYLTAGVFWEPNPNMSLALDYQGLTSDGYPAGAGPVDQSTWFLHYQIAF